MLSAHAVLKLLSTPQSCLTLCSPMDCSLPGSSVHGILQAWILEWVAMSSFRGSSQPRIEPASILSPALSDGFLTTSATCPDGSYQLMALQHQPESPRSPTLSWVTFSVKPSWFGLLIWLFLVFYFFRICLYIAFHYCMY